MILDYRFPKFSIQIGLGLASRAWLYLPFSLENEWLQAINITHNARMVIRGEFEASSPQWGPLCWDRGSQWARFVILLGSSWAALIRSYFTLHTPWILMCFKGHLVVQSVLIVTSSDQLKLSLPFMGDLSDFLASFWRLLFLSSIFWRFSRGKCDFFGC